MKAREISECRKILGSFPVSLRMSVAHLVNQHTGQLASTFYANMLSRPDSKLFLDNQEVKSRLHASMQNWIKQLFNINLEEKLENFADTQKKVGEVHARINLPVHIVLRGAMILKREIYKLIDADETLSVNKPQAIYYSYWLIDYAMELISAAYSSSHDRKTKAEESYRLFSAVTNSEAEREKQSKALLDWENEFLFKLTTKEDLHYLTKIYDSDFGLWFNHKGNYMFETEQREIQVIKESMAAIDSTIDRYLNNGNEDLIGQIKTIRKYIRAINLNVEELFNRHLKLESGRDDLTRLLSRKFLPVILNREINYSINNKKPFAILGIDIDYFKSINDSYGHEAGDRVLNQLGLLLSQRVRAGDYVFRVGGEEFLVLLVDIKHKDNAIRIANQLREKVAKEPFATNRGTLNITCSIGVIMHDGHPDYMRILNDVDEALYEAKNKGRNQVVIK